MSITGLMSSGSRSSASHQRSSGTRRVMSMVVEVLRRGRLVKGRPEFLGAHGRAPARVADVSQAATELGG